MPSNSITRKFAPLSLILSAYSYVALAKDSAPAPPVWPAEIAALAQPLAASAFAASIAPGSSTPADLTDGIIEDYGARMEKAVSKSDLSAVQAYFNDKANSQNLEIIKVEALRLGTNMRRSQTERPANPKRQKWLATILGYGLFPVSPDARVEKLLEGLYKGMLSSKMKEAAPKYGFTVETFSGAVCYKLRERIFMASSAEALAALDQAVDSITDADLARLAAFWETPAGRHFAHESAAAIDDALYPRLVTLGKAITDRAVREKNL